MSNTRLDLANLCLDAFGRVILSDEELEVIEGCEGIASAGANVSCPGSTNGACTNGACGGSTNTNCNNTVSCLLSTNFNGACRRPREMDGE